MSTELHLIDGFPTKLEKARNCSLVGNYDESLSLYEEVYSSLHSSVEQVIHAHEKAELIHSLRCIYDEIQLVNELKKEIEVWNKPPTIKNKISNSNISSNSFPPQIHSNVHPTPKIHQQSDIQHNNPYSKLPFNQIPFQHHHFPNHYVSNHSNHSENRIQPNTENNDENIKDPDVWDPPSPDPYYSKGCNKPLVDATPSPPIYQQKRLAINRGNNASAGVNPKGYGRVPTKSGGSKQKDSERKDPPSKGNKISGASKPNEKPVKGGKQSKDGENKNGKLSYSEMAREEGWADIELIESIERDIVDSSPTIKFEDIAGLEHAKQLLQEAVMLPLLAPHLFTGRIKPSKGILMFGPPGTGKTLLAKAVAHECGTTFFNVSASTLSSKFRGDSEKMVRILFEMARYYAPSTIFMDEIDSIAGARGGASEHEASRRVKTELLVQINGVSSGSEEDRVMLLAATNLPWELDEAMRRRLDKRIYIPLPDEVGRRALFQINLQDTKKMKLASEVNIETLVTATAGYSGSDIHSLCTAAAMMPIRRVYTPEVLKELRNKAADEKIDQPEQLVLTQEDLLNALKDVSKSVGGAELDRYKQWEEEFGSR